VFTLLLSGLKPKPYIILREHEYPPWATIADAKLAKGDRPFVPDAASASNPQRRSGRRPAIFPACGRAGKSTSARAGRRRRVSLRQPPKDQDRLKGRPANPRCSCRSWKANRCEGKCPNAGPRLQLNEVVPIDHFHAQRFFKTSLRLNSGYGQRLNMKCQAYKGIERLDASFQCRSQGVAKCSM
jgi:hypothetical protein